MHSNHTPKLSYICDDDTLTVFHNGNPINIPLTDEIKRIKLDEDICFSINDYNEAGADTAYYKIIEGLIDQALKITSK